MAGYGVGSDAHIKVQTEALIERAENAKKRNFHHGKPSE